MGLGHLRRARRPLLSPPRLQRASATFPAKLLLADRRPWPFCRNLVMERTEPQMGPMHASLCFGARTWASSSASHGPQTVSRSQPSFVLVIPVAFPNHNRKSSSPWSPIIPRRLLSCSSWRTAPCFDGQRFYGGNSALQEGLLVRVSAVPPSQCKVSASRSLSPPIKPLATVPGRLQGGTSNSDDFDLQRD